MNLEYTGIAYRNFRTRSHIAGEAVRLRKATENAFGRRLVPTSLFSCGIEYRQRFGITRQQFAAQRQRVLFGGVREFVDKAFQINRVLVQIHATPETRRHMRIAHRMVDQKIRERVHQRVFGTGRIQALKNHRVFTVAQILRTQAGKNRLA